MGVRGGGALGGEGQKAPAATGHSPTQDTTSRQGAAQASAVSSRAGGASPRSGGEGRKAPSSRAPVPGLCGDVASMVHQVVRAAAPAGVGRGPVAQHDLLRAALE